MSSLAPNQYQIGSFVFGEGTLFNVEQFDVGGYEVNVQDFQATSSDELRFGSDSLKPMPIQITLTAFENSVMTNVAALVKQNQLQDFSSDPKVGQFIREWRDDTARKSWGELKPLLYCRDDGTVVRIYGRPGKLAVSKKDPNKAYRKLVAEFRRSDTLAYSNNEWFTNIQQGEIVNVVRSEEFGMGNAPCWLRLLIVGPMEHPIIQVGDITVELAATIGLNQAIEISSYPWQRRVVRNDGVSFAGNLVSPYLDKLTFPANTPIQLSWNATNVNTIVDTLSFTSIDSSKWNSIQYFGSGSGSMSVSNNKLQWSTSGTASRSAIMIRKQQTVSNYQLVGMTIATPGENVLGLPDPVNRIIGRSNSTGSEYLYWDISWSHCWFGYHKDGQDWVVSQVFTIGTILDRLKRTLASIHNLFETSFGVTGTPAENWKYEAEFGTADGEEYSVLRVNNYVFAAHVPEAVSFSVGTIRPATSTVDPPLGVPVTLLGSSTNRYTGIGMGSLAKTGAQTQSQPGSVSEFHFKDNPPPEVAATLSNSQVLMMWRDAWYEI